MEKFMDVFLNEYGFFELKRKPTVEQQKKIFEEKYYQEGLSVSYEKKYSEEQLKNSDFKLQQKEILIKKYVTYSQERLSLLDIGCGEGFFVKYFEKKGYEVYGIDYSIYGVRTQNPDIERLIYQGDSSEILKKFIEENRKFDVINMDSVLDMMVDPEETLRLCQQILSDRGVLIVKVANNYSELQREFLKRKKLSKEFWLDNPGHPFYFNRKGFEKFFNVHSFDMVDIYGESFIEFNLFNDLTNYYENPSVGKACYNAKIQSENYLYNISLKKMMEIQHIFGEMGIGRELIGVFKKK